MNPFLKESSSGRFMKFVPLPLLTFAASLSLVHSFLKEPHPFVVSSKLARLSGGHPRTIQIIDSISASPAMRAMSWTDDKKFEAVVESTILSFPNRLSEAQIMLLLRPRTLLSEIKTNTELIEALEKGSLYATVLDNSYVELRKLMAGMHLMLSFFIRQFFNIDKTLSINLLQKTVPISFYRNLGIV